MKQVSLCCNPGSQECQGKRIMSLGQDLILEKKVRPLESSFYMPLIHTRNAKKKSSSKWRAMNWPSSRCLNACHTASWLFFSSLVSMNWLFKGKYCLLIRMKNSDTVLWSTPSTRCWAEIWRQFSIDGLPSFSDIAFVFFHGNFQNKDRNAFLSYLEIIFSHC